MKRYITPETEIIIIDGHNLLDDIGAYSGTVTQGEQGEEEGSMGKEDGWGYSSYNLWDD